VAAYRTGGMAPYPLRTEVLHGWQPAGTSCIYEWAPVACWRFGAGPALSGTVAETLGVLLPGFGVPEQLMGWQGAGHYRPGDVGEALVVRVGVPPQDGERMFHVQPAFLGKHPFGLLERDTGGQHGLQLLGEGGPVGCGFVLHQSNAGDVSQGLAQRQVLGVERPDGRAEQPDSSQGSVLQPQRQGMHAQKPGGTRGGDKLASVVLPVPGGACPGKRDRGNAAHVGPSEGGATVAPEQLAHTPEPMTGTAARKPILDWHAEPGGFPIFVSCRPGLEVSA